MDSLLHRTDLAAITDDEVWGLVVIGSPSEQDLLKRLDQLPRIFEANRVFALRLIQLFSYYTDVYPTLARKIKNLAKDLSQEETSNNRRLLAYMFSKVDMLETGKNTLPLMELAEDKEDFAVARRAAISRLIGSVISKEDHARLLNLLSDSEVSGNMFFLLSTCDFDRGALMEALTEEVKRGQTHLIEALRDLIQRSYE